MPGKQKMNRLERYGIYIAHHGVTHPDKVRKGRVVSDCCAEFGGTSLIKQLIAGSD